MASLTKKYNNQKLFGQVYTPRFVVEKILDNIGFNNSNILGKSILDPSCGDGRFLIVVAEKIIQYSPQKNLIENLEKITGWDIDKQAVNLCIDNLNKLLEGLSININWNVKVGNSLKKIIEINQEKYDFIVGNPPYIRIQHLEENERKFIQTHYQFCKSGSTDSYIAFYELCKNLLNDNGVCGLITPNTFFYSDTAKLMRNYFSTNKSIIQITNYADIQLFDNATTYSAITIFGKKKQEYFIFEQAKNEFDFEKRLIHFQEIINQKIWQLSTKNNTQIEEGIKLKDICKIHVGITTLSDKSYIFSIQDIENEPNVVFANTTLKGLVKIEKSILKPIIKASKLKNGDDKIIKFVLFPYKKINGKHQIIAEEELKYNYPFAYQYLLSIKDELDKRDNGKPNSVTWYAFGRSQGLDTSFGKKILFSPINKKPNFILVNNEECTFYSGYCIKYGGDYHTLLQELNSDRFAEFIAISSRDFRGGWKAYNKKAIEDFTLNINYEHLQQQKILDEKINKNSLISKSIAKTLTLDF